jgi:hypothetical protein
MGEDGTRELIQAVPSFHKGRVNGIRWNTLARRVRIQLELAGKALKHRPPGGMFGGMTDAIEEFLLNQNDLLLDMNPAAPP